MEQENHCRIGKIRLKDSGLVIHQFPHSYERTDSAIRARIIESLHHIECEGEPIMYAGILIWEDGRASIGWEYGLEDPVAGCNYRELIRALDEIIFELRLRARGE